MQRARRMKQQKHPDWRNRLNDHHFAKYQGARFRSERSYMAIATRDRAMEIERTAFGTITIDGKTYDHDVVIRLSGEIVKRKKKLSKK